jgi:hypothetical protein
LSVTWRGALSAASFSVLPVRAAQEAEQLDLLGARNDLFRAREFHPGFGKLGDQLVHAHAEHAG